MENFLNVLLQILLPFLGILISIAVAFLIKYISKGFAYIEAKVSLIEDEKVRTLVANTVQDVDMLLNGNIINGGELLKKEILEESKDGKLTSDEAFEIANSVKNSVLDSLNEDSKKLINKTYGNAERFILDRLEVIYAELKNQNKIQ